MGSLDSKIVLRLPVLLAFACIYLIWGSTYLAIRIGIETMPPFLLAGTRFAIAGAALYLVLRLRGAPRPRLSEWRATAVVGALMMVGGNGLVTWAEQIVPSGLTALLVSTMPMWMVALDASFFGGPRPNRWVCAGLLLGLLGVGVLVGPSAEGAVTPFGALVLLFAAFSWANGSLRTRAPSLPRSPWMAAAMEMIAGGAILLCLASASGEWTRLDPSAVSARSLAALAYLVLFGSVVALSAYLYLLRRTSASAVATYAFVNPVVALALGWSIGEPLGARSLAGAILILGAVALIHWARLRPAPEPAAPCRLVDAVTEC
jgi:drug/metabolite transporter (DMT)-like permease